MFGYEVLHYEDATAMLRDKRWHSAVSRIPELMGITNPSFLERQQVSILSAEGDMHTRLRRLVAPAFSPRAADRLRPFMREVISGLVDKVADCRPRRLRHRHLRAVPDPDHLRAARRTEEGLAVVQPLGRRHPRDLLDRRGRQDRPHHADAGRARRVHPRPDRRTAQQAGRRPADRPDRRRGGRRQARATTSW